MSTVIYNSLKVSNKEAARFIYEEINSKNKAASLNSKTDVIEFETKHEPACEMIAEIASRFAEAKLLYEYTILLGSEMYPYDVPFDGSDVYEDGKLIERTIVLSAEEEGNIRNAWEDKENDIEEVIASLKALETYEEMK